MRLFNDQLNLDTSAFPEAKLAGFYAAHAALLFQTYGLQTHSYSFVDSNNRIVYGNFDNSEKEEMLLEGINFLRGTTREYECAAFVSFGTMTDPDHYGFETAFFSTFGATGDNFLKTTSQVAIPCFITEKEIFIGFNAAHLLKTTTAASDDKTVELIMNSFYEGIQAYMKVKNYWLNKDNPYNLTHH